MITGVCTRSACAFIRLSTSMPSMSGIIRSSSTTSKCAGKALSCCQASVPVAAVVVLKPSA